jgi:hypothetical protein
MQAPAVSSYNWERTEALAQIAMGTRSVDVSEMSFADRMELIIEAEPANGLEEIEEEGGSWYSNNWGKSGVKMRIAPTDRDRPHRPEVGDDALNVLDEWVRRTHPNVPVKSIDFDEKLTLLLDTAQEYYSELDCQVVNVNSQERAQQLAERFDT